MKRTWVERTWMDSCWPTKTRLVRGWWIRTEEMRTWRSWTGRRYVSWARSTRLDKKSERGRSRTGQLLLQFAQPLE